MLALRKLRPSPGVDLTEVSPPAATQACDVIVAVEAAGVCGTDIHIDAWTGGYETMRDAMPVTLGHEFAGRVVAANSSGDLPTGTRVVIAPSVTCGRCQACRSGSPDCRHRRGIGIHRDGGFASHVVAPAANCIAIPDELDFEIAALTEPFTVCAQAIARSGLQRGARVLILGPGPIGQGIAVLAAAAGVTDIVVAGRDDAARLAIVPRIAKAQTVDTRGRTLTAALKAADCDAPFDLIFEATGHPSVIGEALACLGERGSLIVCGIHAAPAAIDLTKLVRRQQSVLGTYRAPKPMWLEVIQFLTAHSDLVRPMITHRLPLTEAQGGFALAHQRQASKVMLYPSGLSGVAPAV